VAYLTEYPTQAPGLAGLGWTGRKCCTRLGPCIGTAGHEVITRDALGSGTIWFTGGGRRVPRTLTPAEQRLIIDANVDVDFGSNCQALTQSFTPSEQKVHSLRAYQWTSTPDALREIRAEFHSQHRGIMAERDPAERMRRIGRLLHLIQDPFSPAHTERDPSRWCVTYVRNLGVATRFLYPREHKVPSDDRDLVASTAPVVRAARRRATEATQRYLVIVFKLLHGATTPDPVATREGTAELARFADEVFRLC
jgi:hypothetical protein